MMANVSLTNKELDVLLYYLDWKITEINDTGNEFEYPQIEDIYTRLLGLYKSDNESAKSIKNSSEIMPERDTKAPENKDSKYQPLEHTSECS